MPKLPFIKFFPNDWLAEPTIRVCSLAARGLWMDMLSLMHLSPRRGYLLAATGSPLTPEQLARMTGCSADEVTRLLAELRSSGAFSCTDDGTNTIYSRRMVRDEGKREKCSDAGRKGGGNPTFKGRTKGADKGAAKGDPKALEARSQKPDPPYPPQGRGAVCEPEPAAEVGPKPSEVVAHWNAFPGLTPCAAADANRDRVIRQWATGNPLWAMHWRATIAYMARVPWCIGLGDKHWRATLGWLLKGSNFTETAEKMLAEPAGPRLHSPDPPPVKRARDHPLIDAPNAPPADYAPRPKPPTEGHAA